MTNNVLYNRIGTGYNTTRKADPFLVNELIRLLEAGDKGMYLDIGCGTGNYTRALNQAGIPICGVDPSMAMLDKAHLNAPAIEWKQGSAEAIPYPDLYFDGIIGTLTLHHWSDLKRSFHELNRVLKPGGNLVLFTSTPEQMSGYWLNHYFPDMLQKSIVQMPSPGVVKEALTGTPLTIEQQVKYDIRSDLQDLFLYAGKYHPEYYLDQTIRNGISSFSNLAHAAEVESGLEQLQADIRSGKIQEIMTRYSNHNGDYLFICIHKNTLHT